MSFDIGGPGGTSFPFDTIGDAVTGTILDVEEMQESDFDTGAPKFWPDGKPIMQHRVTLQTELRDEPDDDGQRSVYLRGSRKPESKSTLAAVLQAVKATTGGSALDKGGLLTLRYVGDGVPSQRGRNAPKWYEATYRPPSVSLDEPQQPAPQQPLPYVPPPPAPGAPQNGAASPKGWLNGSPIMPATYAGMVAAGVVPEQLGGWVPAP